MGAPGHNFVVGIKQVGISTSEVTTLPQNLALGAPEPSGGGCQETRKGNGHLPEGANNVATAAPTTRQDPVVQERRGLRFGKICLAIETVACTARNWE